MTKTIDFFTPEIQCLSKEEGCTVYQMDNETGKGVITQYSILSGIEVFYNDFHMSDGHNHNKLPKKDRVEINHCKEGRFECEFNNGDYEYLGAGDLSIHRLTQETKRTLFPMAHYQGISITIDLNQAAQTIKKLEEILGHLNINLFQMADNLCQTDTCYVIRRQSEIAKIFDTFYKIKSDRKLHDLKVKVLELLMYLNDLPTKAYIEEKRYFCKAQVEIIKKIHDFMIENIGYHYTLEELSSRFGISLTAMKICFKGVYGHSIYSYMKAYRMRVAIELLLETHLSITEIAMKMGYQNPSKFSECFKKEFGKRPSDFRK